MLERIDDYAISRVDICRRIESRKATLKIVLKTKNERFLLERWIDHHLKIVGSKNLIVFDNLSDDADVLSVYDRYRDHIVLASFSGYQDNIHHRARYPHLYASIRRSSDYFVFLDTDEFLTWIDSDGTFIEDARLPARIAARSDVGILPGTWLANVPGFADRFYLNSGGTETDETWRWGLHWGKPVYSSKTALPRNCLHNCYAPRSAYASRCCGNVFVRHVNSLSADQRILANMNKLKALGFIARETSVEAVLALAHKDMDSELVREYCEEIRSIGATIDRHKGLKDLTPNTLRFEPDGTIAFYNEDQRRSLQKFIERPEDYIPRLMAL